MPEPVVDTLPTGTQDLLDTDIKQPIAPVKPEDKVEPKKTPDEIWKELSKNARTVALAMGTMSFHTDIRSITKVLDEQQNNRPEERYNATSGIFELFAECVLERKTQEELDKEIIARYEASGETPIPYSHGSPSARQEVASQNYTGAKMRQEELARNPAEHPEWKVPQFLLTPSFRHFTLQQSV